MEKYSRTLQATDGNLVHAHFMLGTRGYKHILSEYVILLVFYYNNGCTNTHQCYITHTLHVLLMFSSSSKVLYVHYLCE